MRLHAAPRRPALRRAAGGLALAVACALGGGCGSAVAQEAATSRAIDPHYGDGLFHFYQDQYFDAVVGLMVSQHFERIAMQADDAEVLRGSMLLSYGLHRGGVQRLYLGNLRAGEHTLVAFFTGKGPHERDYKRGATLKIEKGSDPKYIELRIRDSTQKLQPEFDVKVWQ